MFKSISQPSKTSISKVTCAKILTTLYLLAFPSQFTVLSQEIVVKIGPDGKRIYSNTDPTYAPADIIIKGPVINDPLAKGAPSAPPPHIEKLITQISAEHGVDPDLVKAVAKVESNYNPFAVSYKGAQGMMQLIPGTARRFGVKNVFDAKQNIEGGVKFLKFLSQMFPDNLSYILAAYNAGENSVVRYGGIPPYRETQDYVRKISRIYQPKNDNKKGLIETAQTEPERAITRSLDSSGRVVYSNVEIAY
jgi:soluble lytic murein transglycosylase-like protein